MRATALALLAIALSASTAGAVSQAVRTACSSDYHAYLRGGQNGLIELRRHMVSPPHNVA